jgi:hypothetical protein
MARKITEIDNLPMRFYTYVHRRKTDGRVFYVGKGSGGRAWSGRGRNQYWHRTVKKHGIEIGVAAWWVDEESAFSHERLLIACMRDMGHPIVNGTDGGEGGLLGDWAKEKHAAAMRKVREDPVFRLKLSEKLRRFNAENPDAAAFHSIKMRAKRTEEQKARLERSEKMALDTEFRALENAKKRQKISAAISSAWADFKNNFVGPPKALFTEAKKLELRKKSRAEKVRETKRALWSDPEYRMKMSALLSEKTRKSWADGGTRRTIAYNSTGVECV